MEFRRVACVSVEALQGHRDFFVDVPSSAATTGASLRVNGDVPRRLSSESSHSDVSCHMDYSDATAFGTVIHTRFSQQ